jgi:hypothetical protein
MNKRFARWIVIGPLDVLELVNVARKHGMRCIAGFKPGMCAFNEIGLYGTSEQMKSTEADWKKAGCKPLSRQPRAAFGFNLNAPEEAWVDGPATPAEPMER